MPRLLIAVFAIATAALGLAPAAAQASVTQSQITTWVTQTTDPQGHTSTITNGTYLLSLDNQPSPTTIDVKGNATGSAPLGMLDVVCFYGTGGFSELKTNVGVGSGGTFDTGPVPLRGPANDPVAGHACRLRAVPAGAESTSNLDVPVFAGPQVAVSEAALPASAISGGTVNPGAPYNYYVNDVTFTGWSAWKAVGTNGCGPYVAPIDPSLNVGNYAIDCAGSLLADDLAAWGGRSEVQIDGHNAYDAASAQALVPRTNGQDNGTQDLPGFPTLTAAVNWDPTTGALSSSSQESWVACSGADPYQPKSIANCPSFVDTGVKLERDIGVSDGGRVVTMTDTWSSTDGESHTVDLLYDDYVGLKQNPAVRAYEFPGQSAFASHLAGDPLPGPGAGPGTIFVHTNQAASDGNPAEAYGAITYASAPSGFRFAPGAPASTTPPPPSNEFEEHAVATVPAGGSASLRYVYSVGYTLADVQSLATAAQDGFVPPPVSGASGTPATPAPGTPTVSPVTVTLLPPATPTPAATCHVPKIKGMTLRAAEKALRRAHCRVGSVRHVASHKMAPGRVVSSTPRAGRWLRGAGKVQLLVSAGP
jgi:hypothetical protein